MTITVTSA